MKTGLVPSTAKLKVYLLCLLAALLYFTAAEMIPQGREFHYRLDPDELQSKGNIPSDNLLYYGNYIPAGGGRYRLELDLVNRADQTVNVLLEVAANRGTFQVAAGRFKIEAGQRSSLGLDFHLDERLAVEPRLSIDQEPGSVHIELLGLELEKTGFFFPWYFILLKSLFFSGLLFIFLLSLQSGHLEDDWFFLKLFLLLLGIYMFALRSWATEDAYITLRYVDNFLKGLGPVYNANERVEGFSHPLWFAILTVFKSMGLNSQANLILPGLLCSALFLFTVLFKATEKNEINLLFPFFMATSSVRDFATSGLETSLTFLLLSLLFFYFVKEKNPVAGGVISALLLLTRIDLAVMSAGIFLFYLFSLPGRRKWDYGKKFILPHIIIYLPYLVFRMGYYGFLLPNTFYTKSAGGSYYSQGLFYLYDFVLGTPFTAVALIALLLYILRKKASDPPFSFKLKIGERNLFLMLGLLHGFMVIRGGGDFMHGRFLLPAYLVIVLAAGSYRASSLRVKKLIPIVTVVFLLVSSLIVPVQQRKKTNFFLNINDERHFYYRNHELNFKNFLRKEPIFIWESEGLAARELQRKLQLPLKIAHLHIGFMGYNAGEKVKTLDLLGLTDAVVAHKKISERLRPGHEKFPDLGYIYLEKPTFWNGETPFPFYNEIALIKPYGVLLDLSPRFSMRFAREFGYNPKGAIDQEIEHFLASESARLDQEFLFFLKQMWYPHLAPEKQADFELLYAREYRGSDTELWLKNNRAEVFRLFSHIRSELTFSQFVKNIVFSFESSFIAFD